MASLFEQIYRSGSVLYHSGIMCVSLSLLEAAYNNVTLAPLLVHECIQDTSNLFLPLSTDCVSMMNALVGSQSWIQVTSQLHVISS